jgi:hypothetical protein
MAVDPDVRCPCPWCGYVGPHEVLFTDTSDVVINCGSCEESFMAEQVGTCWYVPVWDE